MERPTITLHLIQATVKPKAVSLSIKIHSVKVFADGKQFRVNRSTDYRIIKKDDIGKVQTNLLLDVPTTLFYAYAYDENKDAMVEACRMACVNKLTALKAIIDASLEATKTVIIEDVGLRDAIISPK